MNKVLRGDLPQGGRGSLARKLSKVANHVHMIVIPRRVRDLGPAEGGRCPQAESMTEPRNAAERFGRDARVGKRPSLQLTNVDFHLPSDLRDARATPHQQVESSVYRIRGVQSCQLSQEISIQGFHSVREKALIAQPLVKTRDRVSE